MTLQCSYYIKSVPRRIALRRNGIMGCCYLWERALRPAHGWGWQAGQREEWQDMIRKFLQCTTIRERIEMLTNTVLQDWSDQDLGIILSAFNLNPEDYAGKEDKIAAIEKYLADYKHSVEQKDTMDCEQMDNTTFLESDKTLYSEKGIINLVHNVLRNN